MNVLTPAELLKAAVKTAPVVQLPAPRFKPKTVEEVLKAANPSWLVDRMLPRTGLGVAYGPPACGKTFMFIDGALSISRGERWFGRRVLRGGVIYLALEGSLAVRLRGYLQHHGLAPSDISPRFRVVDTAVNLLDAEGDLPDLVEQLRVAAFEMGGCVLVVVDTLARAMAGGDENTARDMTALVKNVKVIEQALDCFTVLVHHCGKDELRGARGHSSLLGATDVEIQVKDSVGGLRVASITKLRDDAAGQDFPFRLKVVDLGARAQFDIEADESERITTCVLEPVDQSGRRPDPKFSPATGIALATLRKMVVESRGQVMPGDNQIPQGVRAVRLDQWRESFLRAYGEESGASSDSQKRLLRKAKDDLLEAKVIGVSTPWVWLQ